MKIKYADYPNWNRVTKKGYKSIYVEDKEFKGYVCLLTAIKVKEKLFITKFNKQYVLIDDGFFWLEFYPDKYKNVALSVSITDKGDIREWYFDVAKTTALTDKGVPYIEDLYLDVTITPDGEIELLDEDELEEALKTSDITKEDYDLAYSYANKIIDYCKDNIDELKNLTNKYMKVLREKQETNIS